MIRKRSSVEQQAIRKKPEGIVNPLPLLFPVLSSFGQKKNIRENYATEAYRRFFAVYMKIYTYITLNRTIEPKRRKEK
jgi:hypothetical protein